MNWTAAETIAFLRRTGQAVPDWLSKAKEPKASKYRNVPTEIDGIRFDSKREASRWCELKLLLTAGAIRNLERQVRFRLTADIVYVADFVYWDDGTEQQVIEDSKGVRTKEYRLKKRLMAEAGHQIKEV